MKIDEFVYDLCTKGKGFAALSTLMPDGSPQVSLVWVDSDGEHVLARAAVSAVPQEPPAGAAPGPGEPDDVVVVAAAHQPAVLTVSPDRTGRDQRPAPLRRAEGKP